MLLADLILEESGDSMCPSIADAEVSTEVMNTLILYAKDRHNISDRAYSHLAKIEESLPRLGQIKKRANELNSKCDVKPLPNDMVGVQQSLSIRLMERMHHALNASLETIHFNNNIVRIKLSGDGTNVGKNVHLVNFTFTLVDERVAGSCEGNYVLAIINCEDKYETLSLALTDIIEEVDTLYRIGIELDGVKYLVVLFGWGLEISCCCYRN